MAYRSLQKDEHVPALTRAASPSRPALHPHSLKASWVEDWWLVELAAVFFSCVLTIVLCIILLVYDDKTIPSFGSVLDSGITLGTIVALFSTFIVGFALVGVAEGVSQLKWQWFLDGNKPMADLDIYDRASRSSVGSAGLLWRLRIIRSPVASFGALLMIVQLVVAPLAQQSINYQTRTVAGPERATIPTTTFYLADDGLHIAGTPRGYDAISPAMKAAVTTGLSTRLDTVVDLTPPSCSSGNCTFEHYHLLAVCYNVKNVTSSLKLVGPSYQNTWCLPGGFCLNNTITIAFSPTQVSTYANISTAIEPSRNQALNNTLDNTLDPGFLTVPLNFTSIAFTNHSNPLSDVYIIYEPNFDNKAYAFEFIFDWCAINFTTTVTNGISKSERIGDARYLNFSTISHDRGLDGSTVNVNGTDFTMQPHSHNTLQRYLQTVFKGTYFHMGDNLGPFSADSEIVEVLVDQLNIGSVEVSLEDTDSVPTTTNTTLNLEVLLGNTVVNMGNYLRTVAGGNATGITLVQENIVVVHWRWLAAPIVFCAGSTIFVVLVILFHHFHRNGRMCAWKSSNLALLQGAAPDLHAQLGGMTRNSDTKYVAESLHVALQRPDNDGWRLVPVQSTPMEMATPLPKSESRAGLSLERTEVMH